MIHGEERAMEKNFLICFRINFNLHFKRINFTHPIKIKGRYSYHIILACRKSKGKRDYTDAWIELGEKMTDLRDKHVEIALKICQGQAKLEDFREFFRQRTLENFV